MSIKKQSTNQTPIVWPTYTTQELDNFELMVNRHLIETSRGPAPDFQECAVEYGAMSKKYGGGSYAVILDGSYPTKFQLFNKIFDAWITRKSKIEWAQNENEKRQNISVDKLANQMKWPDALT